MGVGFFRGFTVIIFFSRIREGCYILVIVILTWRFIASLYRLYALFLFWPIYRRKKWKQKKSKKIFQVTKWKRNKCTYFPDDRNLLWERLLRISPLLCTWFFISPSIFFNYYILQYNEKKWRNETKTQWCTDITPASPLFLTKSYSSMIFDRK